MSRRITREIARAIAISATVKVFTERAAELTVEQAEIGNELLDELLGGNKETMNALPEGYFAERRSLNVNAGGYRVGFYFGHEPGLEGLVSRTEKYGFNPTFFTEPVRQKLEEDGFEFDTVLRRIPEFMDRGTARADLTDEQQIERVQTFAKIESDFCDEVVGFYQNIQAVVSSYKTFSQLFAAWPEAKNLVNQEWLEPASTGLPAPQIEAIIGRVNKAIAA